MKFGTIVLPINTHRLTPGVRDRPIHSTANVNSYRTANCKTASGCLSRGGLASQFTVDVHSS